MKPVTFRSASVYRLKVLAEPSRQLANNGRKMLGEFASMSQTMVAFTLAPLNDEQAVRQCGPWRGALAAGGAGQMAMPAVLEAARRLQPSQP
jgi:hypothetical protein